jgi:hypothetical protein
MSLTAYRLWWTLACGWELNTCIQSLLVISITQDRREEQGQERGNGIKDKEEISG